MSRPMQFRSPKGTGSIYEAGGLFYIRYSTGSRENRRQWSSPPYATRADAELARAANAKPVSADWMAKTWGEHLDEFVPRRLGLLQANDQWSYATILQRYYRRLDPLLRPLGRVSATTAQDIGRVLDALLVDGVAEGTVRRIKSEGVTCWKGAQALGLPVVNNPFADAVVDKRLAAKTAKTAKKRGRVTDEDTEALTHSEWKILRDAMVDVFLNGPTRTIRTTRWALPVIIEGDTGCRRGESLGLRLNNVKLGTKPHLIIKEQVKQDHRNGGWELGDPKTLASWRTLSTGPELAKLIRIHIERNGLSGRDLLFSDDNGDVLKPDSLTRWLPGAARRLGIETRCTPHVLRDTHITLLLSKGVNDVLVSARAGHGSTVYTRSAYEKYIARPDDGLGAEYEAIMRDV